jgi:hypothetical protein
MNKTHLNALITQFITFLIVFSVIYGTSLYALSRLISDINIAMLLHILNIFIMFMIALAITKSLSRFFHSTKEQH